MGGDLVLDKIMMGCSSGQINSVRPDAAPLI